MDALGLHDQLLMRRYFNEDGIVTIQQAAPTIPGDGNGLLQTGLFYCIKAVQNVLSARDAEWINLITDRCSHEKFPIFWRSPHKKNPGDGQKCDDYWGWLAALYHIKSSYAHLFHMFGEEHGWVIDVELPDDPIDDLTPRTFTYYFDRFFGFRIFAKMCSRPTARHLKITYREHAEIALVSLYKIFSIDSSDGCMRDYCFFTVVAKESAVGKIMASWWEQRVRKKYGSVGASFANYFKDPKHPLCGGDWPVV